MKTQVISFIVFSLCIALGASQTYDPIIEACLGPVTNRTKAAISSGIHETMGKVEVRTARKWVEATVYVAIEAGGYCIQENSGIDEKIINRVERDIKDEMYFRIKEAVQDCYGRRKLIRSTTERCLITATYDASDESVIQTRRAFRKLEDKGQI